MVFKKTDYLPTYEELEVENVPLGSPYLKAGAFHLGKYCEPQNNEFMLCRGELKDPRLCLNEGKDVTSCSLNFFRAVKRSCAAEFTSYAMCLERSDRSMVYNKCRNTQAIFDQCVSQNMGLERPHYGYHSLVKVHQTSRPKPAEERPKWLDDPKGQGKRADVLPDNYPRDKSYGYVPNDNLFY